MIVALSAPFPGVSRVFEEGEKLGLWTFHLVERETDIPPADTYILGAWSPAYDAMLSRLSGKVGVLWTSSAGEMDLEPVEIEMLRHVLRDPRIDFIWFGDQSLGKMWDKGFYCPYPLDYRPEPSCDPQRVISLWAPGTLKKNLLNQLLAVSAFQGEGNSVKLYTNVSLDPIRRLGITLDAVEFGWLDRKRYHEILRRSLVNLSTSWAETFSYQMAEATMLGVPTVSSSAIRWGRGEVMPNDPEDITREISLSIRDRSARVEYLREALDRYSRDSRQQLVETLVDRGLGTAIESTSEVGRPPNLFACRGDHDHQRHPITHAHDGRHWRPVVSNGPVIRPGGPGPDDRPPGNAN